jgi:hypothetical protein
MGVILGEGEAREFERRPLEEGDLSSDIEFEELSCPDEVPFTKSVKASGPMKPVPSGSNCSNNMVNSLSSIHPRRNLVKPIFNSCASILPSPFKSINLNISFAFALVLPPGFQPNLSKAVLRFSFPLKKSLILYNDDFGDFLLDVVDVDVVDGDKMMVPLDDVCWLDLFMEPDLVLGEGDGEVSRAFEPLRDMLVDVLGFKEGLGYKY